MKDAEIVARTLWGECRGESLAGKLAVASVIWNRAQGKTDRLARVCLKPRQFSCWNNGDLLEAVMDGDAGSECELIACGMFAGEFSPTLEATHYHAAQVTPWWTPGMEYCGQIGNHLFYRGV